MTTTALTAKNLILSGTEERALVLLGKGVTPAQTAAALGITESAISQLLSKDEFADAVAELRYKNLLSHSERDEKADSLEDRLLKKLADCIPYLMRPMEIARIYQIINGAKRRGQSAPESITASQEVVPLIMPTIITNKFTVNVNNQVIQAGQQPLITVQSGSMQALLSKHKESQDVNLLTNGSPST
jgi:predicted transcriptional regulator